MRRTTWQLSELREECRKAQSIDDLKQILEAVLDHLYYVENDYWLQKPRERHGP